MGVDVTRAATEERADLAPGTLVGRYVIEERIGSGGMGVVYAASDPALGRRVAVKLVRTPGGERSARLMREARALASVSHPNVLPIYDVGAIGEELFIAMELVPGRTLKAWLATRRAWREIRPVMLEAGRGLAAAHAAGLVHRDFKPDNVLVGDDGAVKVMDFGLAREVGQEVPAGATGEVDVTQSGALMGTVAYMAPEQHQGRAADERADQFAYCVTLYEALYGERPFAAPDGVPTALGIGAEVLQGHVRPAPPGSRVPRRLRELIVRGLAVDPDARHASMHVLLAELARRSQTWRWVAAAIGLAAIAAATAFVLARSDGAATRAAPVVATTIHRQVSFTGEAELPVLSPDGTRIAYVTGRPPRQRLIVQELRSGRARTLSWWQFINDAAWSPDGTRLLVVPLNENVYIVDASTGARRPLPVSGQAAAWSPDGTSIVVAHLTKRLVIVDVNGAVKREVDLDVPSTWLAGIDWSRDDALLVLTVEARGHGLWTMRPDGGDARKIVDDATATTAQMPRWVGDGFRYYRGEGGPGEIVDYAVLPGGVAARREALLSMHDLGDVYSSSADGKQLAYVRTRRSESLVRVSPDHGAGRVRPLIRGTQRIFAAACSHDGARVAVAMGSVETAAQLFVLSTSGGAIREISSEREHVGAIAWSPDGASLAYTVTRQGATELRRVEVKGGPWTRLPAPDLSGDRPALRWAPGGEIYYHARGQTNYVRLDPRTGARRPLLADDSRGWIFNVTPSPDGTRIAFEWNRRDLGRMSLWTVSLADGSETELSTDLLQPLGWTADGSSVIAGYGRWRGEGVLAVPRDGATPRSIVSDVPPELHAAWWVHVPGSDDVIALDRVTQSDVWLTGDFAPDAVAAVALPASDPELPPGHPVPPSAVADNLDFEGGTTAGWYVPEGRRGALSISDEACSGHRSLRIDAAAAQYVDAAPYRGRRVKLRACLRGEARLWLEAELFDGEVLRAESRTGVARANGWRDHETSIYIPRETQYLELGATLDGTGTGWLDGVELAIVP